MKVISIGGFLYVRNHIYIQIAMIVLKHFKKLSR